MNIEEIRTFLAIVHTKRISAAAEQLFITQSATSQRLRALEEEMNCTLLVRKKGKKMLELTHKGQLFLPLAEKFNSIHEEMESIQYQKHYISLYIGAISSVNSLILGDFYNRLLLENLSNDVNLQIRTNWSDELYERLNRKKIDIALTAEKFIYKNIISRTIYKEKLYIVTLKGSAFEGRKTVHPNELLRHDEIYISWSNDIDQWHNLWWPLSTDYYVHIDDLTIVKDFFTNNNKWAIVTDSMVKYLYPLNKFSFFNIASPPPLREIFITKHTHVDSNKKKVVEEFELLLLDFLEQHSKSVENILNELELV